MVTNLIQWRGVFCQSVAIIFAVVLFSPQWANGAVVYQQTATSTKYLLFGQTYQTGLVSRQSLGTDLFGEVDSIDLWVQLHATTLISVHLYEYSDVGMTVQTGHWSSATTTGDYIPQAWKNFELNATSTLETDKYYRIDVYDDGSGAVSIGGIAGSATSPWGGGVWSSNIVESCIGGLSVFSCAGGDSEPWSGGDMAFRLNGSGGTGGSPDDDTTRIIYTVPLLDETISSSTDATSGANVYVDPGDFDISDGWRMRQRWGYARDGAFAVGSPENFLTEVEIDITDGGIQLLTHNAGILDREGGYYLETQLRVDSTVGDLVHWFGFQDIFDPGLVVSTTTKFYAGEVTAFDTFMDETEQSLIDFAASSTIPMDACNPSLGFQMRDCLNLLFMWQPQFMGEAWQSLVDGFLSSFPLGYGTRFMEVLSTVQPQALPDVSFSFADDFPVSALAGSNFHFEVWDYFYTPGSPMYETKSTGDDPKNFWEILEPLYTFMVHMALLLMIISDLTRMNLVHKHLITESICG